MAKPPISEEVPLYVRWSPDRAPYGIELRLDLVAKIAAQVALSEKLGSELGGFLIGSLPLASVPTIRIDDIEMVSNGSDDETVFLPEPSQYQRFPPIRGRPGSRASSIVGFFRSHARIGPMRPSPADRGILSHQFQNGVYVVLLIGTQPPHTAAFFVGANGQLPDETSVREFAFNEQAFKALPEVPAEAPQIEPPEETQPLSANLRTYATIAALLLIAIAACAFMWSFAHQGTGRNWFGPSDRLHLAVKPEDNLAAASPLRITWDHSAKELKTSSGATLIITDGSIRSELPLGPDDLRLGAVDYQSKSTRVEIEMVLNTAAGQVMRDSAEWTGQ